MRGIYIWGAWRGYVLIRTSTGPSNHPRKSKYPSLPISPVEGPDPRLGRKIFLYPGCGSRGAVGGGRWDGREGGREGREGARIRWEGMWGRREMG